MNIISLSIFVVLFFFENADGASKCYQCAGSSCATNPVGVEQACGNSVSFCQKVTTVTAGITVITKNCADICVNGNTQAFGPSIITYECCSFDLCNSSSSSQNKGNFLILSLILISLRICLKMSN